MEDTEKNKKKKRYWRQMLKLVMGIFALVGLFGMLLCAVNPYISPNTFVLTSFFGLTFWPIFFFNLLVLIILIIIKSKKRLLIPIVALIIAIPGLLKSYSFGNKPVEEGGLKIMSYNVGNFWDITDNQRNWSDVRNDMIEIIVAQNPDIVCLQESGAWNDKTISEFAEKIGCKYCANKNKGNIIFSKYPIENDEFTLNYDTIDAPGFMRKINAGDRGVFYVECVHLQSFMISKEEIQYLSDAKNYVENSETVGKSLLFKLKDGFERRTNDTKVMLNNLPKDLPIIICGDFNDTPQSYTYHKMREAGLEDAFLSVGNGVGKTYCDKLPMLRIDYFWCSNDIVPMTFDRVTRKMSDHYPIIMTFNVIN